MRDYNFFSPYLDNKKEGKDKTVVYIVVAAFVLASAIGTYGWNALRLHSMEKEIASIDSYLSAEATMQGIKQYNETQQKIKVLKEYQVLVEDINNRILGSDKVNSALLNRITSTLPKTIDLNIVSATAGGIQLQGTSEDRTAIAEYIYNLKETKAFSVVHVSSINQTGTAGRGYMFTLICKLGGDSNNEAE